MSDSLTGSAAALNSSAYVAGVTVAVLRKALDLMQIQGEAVVTMIEAAAVTTITDAGAGPPVQVSDPFAGNQVDLLV